MEDTAATPPLPPLVDPADRPYRYMSRRQLAIILDGADRLNLTDTDAERTMCAAIRADVRFELNYRAAWSK